MVATAYSESLIFKGTFEKSHAYPHLSIKKLFSDKMAQIKYHRSRVNYWKGRLIVKLDWSLLNFICFSYCFIAPIKLLSDMTNNLENLWNRTIRRLMLYVLKRPRHFVFIDVLSVAEMARGDYYWRRHKQGSPHCLGCCWSGARPTNNISIEFKIRPKFAMFRFKINFTDYNEIMHTSRQCYCRDVCKISLWSVTHILN